MNNTLVFKIGRIIFGIPFLCFGINHLIAADLMASMLHPAIPYKLFWMYFTGVALLAASIGIFTRRHLKLACYGLISFLCLVILTVHIPALMAGNNMPLPVIGILKDWGLIAGALMLSTSEVKA